MSALGDRYVVERHGRRWTVVDLADNSHGPLYPTHDQARQAARRRNQPPPSKPRTTQGSLFDPREAT